MARSVNMNIDEGHLGGYIRASTLPTSSGLNIEHGDPATYSPDLWSWAYTELEVRSVLDVGCGEGHCAAFFEDLGCEVLGVDGSVQAKRASVIPDHHIVHDFVTGAYSPTSQFDLVWSCEFVEHVEKRYMANFLETFGASRHYIMMTYAPPRQGGWHHVNCRPERYWVRKLKTLGFRYDHDLTVVSRKISGPGHYHTKGLLFVRV